MANMGRARCAEGNPATLDRVYEVQRRQNARDNQQQLLVVFAIAVRMGQQNENGPTSFIHVHAAP
jgi:hypothetical protein